MEMHQVRYFLLVCETLNFTRAAEQCNVAQPSLTRAMKKLENELGGPLFRRERTRTHLTDLGNLVRPHLESIHASNEAVQAEAKDYWELEKAPLKLGMMCTIGPARLVGFFNRLRREIPSLELSLHEAPGKQLIEEMMSGELDIALIGMPTLPELLDGRSLYSERYVIAFPKGHRFGTMNSVPVMALDQEQYLSRLHCEFPDHFAALGLTPEHAVNIIYRSEREDWIQAMILAGMGCAIMPEFLPMLPGIATRILVDPEVERVIKLVTVAGRRFSPTVQTFVRLAQRFDWANS